MRRLLGVALAAVWLVTLACAETAVTPAMHCQRPHMPCCPRSGSHAQCSPLQCSEQAFQKSDAGNATEAPAADRAAAPVAAVAQRCRSSVRELMPGLCYRATVFRLKDDLRI